MKLSRVTLCCVLAVASVASADPVPDQARALAERGRQLHEQGHYSAAIDAFEKAYLLAPSTGLLFNLGQAHRLAGNCDDAAAMYRRYLANEPRDRARKVARSQLASLDHCAVASHGKTAVSRRAARDRAPTRARPRRGVTMTRIGIGTTVGGAIALGAAAYYGWQAHDASNEVARGYAMGTTWPELVPVHERGERAASRAWLLGVSGGIAAVTGVSLYVAGKRKAREFPIVVSGKDGGAQVGVKWKF
ncbi:MAG: tetratricopeptide repeat protein [Kofleriaceae bacterium]